MNDIPDVPSPGGAASVGASDDAEQPRPLTAIDLETALDSEATSRGGGGREPQHDQATGAEIVADLAGCREWWRLRACDLAPWLRSLPASSISPLFEGDGRPGEPWDGRIGVGSGVSHLSAVDVTLLLHNLQTGIAGMGIKGVAAPGQRSVRLCADGSSKQPMLVIDIGFPDFVLPLSIEASEFSWSEPISLATVTGNMLRLIRAAWQMRVRIARRELAMRRAIEESIVKMGAGVAPAWLRMEPIAHYTDPGFLPAAGYTMLIAMLDQNLVWAPSASDWVRNVTDVRRICRFERSNQRVRCEALRRLTTLGSEGFVSEVALALMQTSGLDPMQTFLTAKGHRLPSPEGKVEMLRTGRRETLNFTDGCLHASIELGVGIYTTGQTVLWGEYPESITLALKGRQMSEIVDHPAFRTVDMKVTKVDNAGGLLTLHHNPRMAPIEDLRA